jgi:hypothetical protein
MILGLWTSGVIGTGLTGQSDGTETRGSGSVQLVSVTVCVIVLSRDIVVIIVVQCVLIIGSVEESTGADLSSREIPILSLKAGLGMSAISSPATIPKGGVHIVGSEDQGLLRWPRPFRVVLWVYPWDWWWREARGRAGSPPNSIFGGSQAAAAAVFGGN